MVALASSRSDLVVKAQIPSPIAASAQIAAITIQVVGRASLLLDEASML